jgi:hypothetical protein
MTAPVATYHIDALNTATASTNKIHDDEVARQYGFHGGLVPGVDVYAYLTRAPVERWGRDWLRHGGVHARFVKPVYDGDEVEVRAAEEADGVLAVEVRDSGGDRCATATAWLAPAPIERPRPGSAELPEVRPPAGPESLAAGTVLGSLSDRFDPDRAEGYLADVRETLPVYRDAAGGPVAHPGWLLRFANSVLSRNVELGPWIHVESDVRLLGLVGPAQAIDVHAAVLDEFARKGHRFVTLDVLVLADGNPVQRVTHTAIHTLRPA